MSKGPNALVPEPRISDDTPAKTSSRRLSADRIVTRLRRRTSSGGYLPQVDGVRFIAIVSVFFFHILRFMRLAKGVPRVQIDDPIGLFIMQGRLGVLVFFVLSGFILAIPFVRHRTASGPRVGLSRYYLRRLTRIEPPYLVALFLSAVVAFLFLDWDHLTAAGVLQHSAWGMIYSNTLVFGSPNKINPAFWTLEIEVQFYVIVPLLALVFAVRRAQTRRLLLIAAIVATTSMQLANLASLAAGQHTYGAIWNYIQYFLCGFLVADLYVNSWKEKPKQTAIWDLVALLGWPAFFLLGMSSGAGNLGAVVYLIAPWLLVVLFISVFRGPRSSIVLSNRWITTIGGMTYSIYLVHSPVIGILTSRIYGAATGISPLDILGASLFLIPAVLAVAVPFYLLVEQPCMNPGWVTNIAARLSGRQRNPRRELRTPTP